MLAKRYLLVLAVTFFGTIDASAFYGHEYASDLGTNRSLVRLKRDEESCSYNEYECSDGLCVRAQADCNGNFECADGSDETFALCRTRSCNKAQFRCNYGACIDKGDVCNGRRDCVDNSDELGSKCTGEEWIVGGQFKCRSGQLIPEKGRCDGVADCKDGSDESVAACVGLVCQPEQFQCGYGGCVEGAAKCNGTAECRDGTDELLEVCGKITLVQTSDLNNSTTEVKVIKCALPQQPENGVYRIVSETNLNDADYVYLEYACYPGFKLVGEVKVLCWRGAWPELPHCVQTCPLARHDSVEYQCTDEDADVLRSCGPEEPEGAIARPKCKQHYYSPVELPYMRCSGGAWSSGPICAPECGTLTVKLTPLVLGGEVARFGDVPWHIGIYRKEDSSDQYQQICGGSLISNTVVLSAAHCFWDERYRRLEDVARFALAAGKLYRAWYNPKDEHYAQKSNVSKIVVPRLYRGLELDYHHDIAAVIASQPFQYKLYVRPVCLDFRADFCAEQLKDGSYGKAAGWGLTTEFRGSESQELKMIDLPYVDEETCLDQTSKAYLHYYVYDKICAGSLEGEALCRGDSGGGLSFASNISGVERYYLRGIASTSPLLKDRVSCNVNSLTSFTSVIKEQGAGLRAQPSP
ncbi:unnamed protein product, partial [Iphiclides podalirius]